MTVGVVLLGAGVGLVHVAELRIDSGVAAMIAGSVPLQVVVWRTLAGERVPRATLIAALVGLVGLALVVGVGQRARRRDDGGRAARDAHGDDVLVARLVRLDARLAPRRPVRRDGVARCSAAGWRCSLAGTIWGEWSEVTRDALRARAGARPGRTSRPLGSVVGFTAYAWLLHNAPISQVVTHQYVNPLVAVALGALILDERPGPTTLAGAVLIVGAVVATVRREGRGHARPAPVGAPARGR